MDSVGAIQVVGAGGEDGCALRDGGYFNVEFTSAEVKPFALDVEVLSDRGRLCLEPAAEEDSRTCLSSCKPSGAEINVLIGAAAAVKVFDQETVRLTLEVLGPLFVNAFGH